MLEPGKLYTVEELAQELKVHAVTVRRWVRSGRLRAVRPGRRIFVLGADVLALRSELGSGEAKSAGGERGAHEGQPKPEPTV